MKFTKASVHNIYKDIKCAKGTEKVFSIIERGSFKAERIISRGAKSPDNFWYDQKRDELVFLLKGKARLVFYDGKTISLKAGDYLLIPKKVKHRVEYTSSRPECVWLCFFGKFKG